MPVLYLYFIRYGFSRSGELQVFQYYCQAKKVKSIFFLVLLLSLTGLEVLSGQNVMLFNGSRHKVGLMTGYGEQFSRENRYYYHPYFVEGQYSYALIRKNLWGLEILAQPQYNITSYTEDQFSSVLLKGHEFGLNIGILLRSNFCSDRVSLYAVASLGPHFVSGVPDRQSRGFIFSDNLFVGVNVLIYRSLYLDLRTGTRHISNAELKQPNGGLNNYVYKAGFMIVL
jgi:hypothetical protein